MRIIQLEALKSVVPQLDLVGEIEKGFVAYSRGQSVVPPVGELVMRDPPGDVHIKYGYLEGDDYYVIKIASGFYENPGRGLPSSNGMMLAFSQATGEPQAVLLDEGYLTDVRTAIAGAIAAKYLAPSAIDRIGIMGTGMQARLQAEYLMNITPCRELLAWGRTPERLESIRVDLDEMGYSADTTTDESEIRDRCDLVVTTTPATTPILNGPLRPGTHVTAVGSDTHDKQELDHSILAAADLVVADSISQCLERGEIHQALKAGAIAETGRGSSTRPWPAC